MMIPRAVSQMGTGLFLMSRFLIAYLLVSIIYRRQIRSIKFKDISRGAILGFLVFLLYLFQSVSLSKASSFEEATLLSISIVLIPFLSVFIFKAKPSKVEVIATIVCIVGLCLLGSIPDVISLLSILLIALHIVFTAHFVKESNPVHLVVAQTAVGTICSMFVCNKDIPTGVDLISWGIVFYTAIIATTWGLLTQTRAQRVVSPVKIGLILTLQPCFIGLICMSFGLYQVSSVEVIGIGLILGGLVAICKGRGKNAQEV